MTPEQSLPLFLRDFVFMSDQKTFGQDINFELTFYTDRYADGLSN